MLDEVLRLHTQLRYEKVLQTFLASDGLSRGETM
jgi:hypothetical protein